MDMPIQEAVTGTGIKPQMPTEPTPEAKALKFEMPDPSLMGDVDSRITIDNKPVEIEKAKVKESEIQPKVTEEKPVAKTEEKKTESKSSVLKAPVEEKKVEVNTTESKVGETKPIIKPITPVRETKGGEDTFEYAKYTPEQQSVLKQMSNVAKKEYAKVIDENKQLASLKDSNYLQHPDAYTLSPDFQSLQTKTYRAQVEGQAWEQALLDIKAGKDYQEITGFNQQGQATFQTRKATDRDEIRVNNNLAACISASRDFNNQLQQFPNQFKQRISTDLQAIQQAQKERFAWHQDPKLLDYSVSVEGKGDTKLKDIKSEFKSMWPQYLQNNPAVDIAGDMFVAMMIQGAELREALNGKQLAQMQKEESSRVEPSSDNREVETKIGEKGIPKTFSLAGLENIGV